MSFLKIFSTNKLENVKPKQLATSDMNNMAEIAMEKSNRPGELAIFRNFHKRIEEFNEIFQNRELIHASKRFN